jgi:peptide methionine sulfoxide reductase msrA/msrB
MKTPIVKYLYICIAAIMVTGCVNADTKPINDTTKNMKEIYFAGGCFWGTEHYFKMIDGVVGTEVGYANGTTDNPTYKDVCTDTTGYAETVKVQYDPDKIDLKFLVGMFFKAINPTSVNRQGNDTGTQYRTGIFYTDSADVKIIESVRDEVAKQYTKPIATQVLPLKNFYRAEEYHQDYLDKNPNGYCHLPQELFDYARKAKPTK